MPEQDIQKQPTENTVIGLMSGTSLDGLDIACCHFRRSGSSWQYEVLAAETIPYDIAWKNRLAFLENGSAYEYALTDVEYGHLLGTLTRKFIQKHKLTPGLIASHGHTIFHQPDKRLTSQIGRGSAIAAETGLPVVCDFRSLDVALGGQGAPLVPIGDALLFGEFGFCLNLGGFANISFDDGGNRIAYDICPANIVLNHLSGREGLSFDPEGRNARSGRIDHALLDALNNLPFYRQSPPKSLGKEWVLAVIHPLLDKTSAPARDLMATMTEHIASQIADATRHGFGARMLVTGGGAHNHFLVERIRHYSQAEVIIPGTLTVDFKEAVIFAFLGLLRSLGEINCLQSVTGAHHDHAGGAIY